MTEKDILTIAEHYRSRAPIEVPAYAQYTAKSKENGYEHNCRINGGTRIINMRYGGIPEHPMLLWNKGILGLRIERSRDMAISAYIESFGLMENGFLDINGLVQLKLIKMELQPRNK